MFSNDREIISPKLDKEGSTPQNESLQLGYYISQDKHGDVRASPNNHPPDNKHNDSDFEFDNFDWPLDDVVTASTVVTYSQAQQQNCCHCVMQIVAMMKYLLIMKLINQRM